MFISLHIYITFIFNWHLLEPILAMFLCSEQVLIIPFISFSVFISSFLGVYNMMSSSHLSKEKAEITVGVRDT